MPTTVATAAETLAGPRETRPPRSTPATLDAADGYAVSPHAAHVELLDSPDGEVVHTLAHPRESGAPLTFLLQADPGNGWFEVLVPVRPNGTTAWLRADEVTVQSLPYRLEMSTARNELVVLEDGQPVRTLQAASGTGDTPTPHGTFFLTELIEPTNAGYGPYAYGLSAFSEVLSSFGGGPGQIGLHGTDDPSSIGRAVSHGCIRLSDEDITYLAELLPLGTPVHIT